MPLSHRGPQLSFQPEGAEDADLEPSSGTKVIDSRAQSSGLQSSKEKLDPKIGGNSYRNSIDIPNQTYNSINKSSHTIDNTSTWIGSQGQF